jgi:predicted dehydrogenase
MNSRLNRRTFLQRSLLTAGAFSVTPLLGPNILKAQDASRKLNCAIIGCGGRSLTHLQWIVEQAGDNVIAFVDPDESKFPRLNTYLQKQGRDPQKVQTFSDYRKMYDKIGAEIDAVFIAAPNHHHAPASILAMERDKAVYCEKPLTHSIAECRKLSKMARLSKAATQMGNQGHCDDGYRRLCEFVWGGVVGNITETHSWTDRANGGVGPRPPSSPVPKGLDWDAWIGPAPYRDYHTDLHPHSWHGWHDFGNGSLGNMGCHVLDGVYWALKIEHPTSVEAEDVIGGSDERYPIGSRLRFDIPARGSMPPMKAYWYEGLRKSGDQGELGSSRAVKGDARNFPPLLVELQKQYPDEEMDRPDSGTLYVGEKGILYTATYGNKFHILPMEKMNQIEQPPRTMPRPKNIMQDFLDAVRKGTKETAADFDYGARLTEFTLLGNLAQRAGAGNKIEWNGSEMKVTNLSEANRWVGRSPRKGWPA